MQTFLPYPDYKKSMEALDDTRLGNQIWREGLTLIRGGWKNHPANKMWRGYEYQLGLYLLAGLDVLEERNKKSYPELREKILNEMSKFKNNGPPPWLGNEDFHASHRSNLLRKANEALQKSAQAKSDKTKEKYLKIYNWYYNFSWKESPDLPYIWPVK